MLDDLAIGQPVVRKDDGEHLVGRVVGIALAPMGTLYDVEFSNIIAKALFSHELEPATASDIQAALSLVASGAWAGLTFEGAHNTSREVFVRAQYAIMLKELLAWDGLVPGTQHDEVSSRYALEETIAIHEKNSWLLGKITGVRRRGQTVSYAVETMDGLQTRDKEELFALDKVANGLARRSLGDRVRYVVPGHEHDEDYLGVVCALQEDGSSIRYAMQFDDGDVFEGLGENEISPA